MVDSLLASCARAEGHPIQFQRLLDQARGYADWETLPLRAEDSGLAPLAYLHFQVPGLPLPEDTRRTLSALTLRHRQASHIRNLVLVEILSALKEGDISVLVLKGAALANSVYPRPELRPMRDMDILVHQGDVARTQAKLLDLDFQPLQLPTGETGAPHHLPPVQRMVEGLLVSVEVHHRLFPFTANAPTYEELSADSIPFSLNEMAAQTLGHEDMLWHIYRHSFAPPLIEKPIRLIWVADFVSLVEKYVDEIDWEKVKGKYPEVWNVLPVFHFLTPWSQETLDLLNIDVDPAPKGIGQSFQGWPRFSMAQQRQKGLRQILLDTFWPSEWWLQLYYGVDRHSPRWWWTRLLRHPLHIVGWLLQYLRQRVKGPNE